MKKMFIGFVLLSGICFQHSATAQSAFYRFNQLQVDKVKRQLSSTCTGFGSQKDLPEKKVNADKKLIAFLNDFYNKSWSPDEVAAQLTTAFKKNWKFTIDTLGAIIKYETSIANPGNLTSAISFSVFQNEIVYKKIYFHTVTGTVCVSPRSDMPGSQDINYIDIICLPLMNFPATICASCGPAVAAKTEEASLSHYKGQDYKLIDTDSTKVNALSWSDMDVYKADSIDAELYTLTNNHNSFMLFQLLYSPNHIMALNAMEALSYLQATHVINLPVNYKEKIEALKTAPIAINWKEGNSVQPGIVYKDKALTDEQIAAKFSRHE